MNQGTIDAIARFSFAITAAVTVLGWFIVARQTERREFRKEVRELIRDLRERLRNINKSASGYWLHTVDDPAICAIALKSDIQGLIKQIAILQEVGIVVDPVMIVRIRTSATGGEFEQVERVPSKLDHARLEGLAHAIEDVIFEVDRAFYHLFPPVKRSRIGRIIPFVGLLGLASDSGDQN